MRIPLEEEESGPRAIFAVDLSRQRSGDGLADIVRIPNGEVCYWPNLGYGRFGGKDHHGSVSGSIAGANTTKGRDQMGQTGAKLANRVLWSGDHAGNLGPLVGQRRHDILSAIAVLDLGTIGLTIVGKPI